MKVPHKLYWFVYYLQLRIHLSTFNSFKYFLKYTLTVLNILFDVFCLPSEQQQVALYQLGIHCLFVFFYRMLIIDNFIPPEEKNKILNRAEYDEESDVWGLKPLAKAEG